MEPTVGQKVICNGYPGIVTTVCGGQLTGMVEVRLARGSVCVPYSYPDCYPSIDASEFEQWSQTDEAKKYMSRREMAEKFAEFVLAKRSI
jgi:hypothetical protein